MILCHQVDHEFCLGLSWWSCFSAKVKTCYSDNCKITPMIVTMFCMYQATTDRCVQSTSVIKQLGTGPLAEIITEWAGVWWASASTALVASSSVRETDKPSRAQQLLTLAMTRGHWYRDMCIRWYQSSLVLDVRGTSWQDSNATSDQTWLRLV